MSTSVRPADLRSWGLRSVAAVVAIAGAAAMAVVLGGAAGQLLLIGASLGVLMVLWPELGLLLAVLQVALPPQYLWVRGTALDSANNVVLLAGLLLWVVLKGVRRLSTPLLWAYLAVFLLTFSLSSPYPGLGTVQPIKTLVAFAIGPVLYCLEFPPSMRRRLWVLLAGFAVINVGVGVVLSGLGLHSLYHVDPDGTWRLEGATIPANLALMALAGVIVGLHGYTRFRRRYLLGLALFNFALIGLTGTRGSFGAATIVLAVYLWPTVRTAMRGRITRFGQLVIVVLGSIFVLGEAVPVLIERTFGRGIDTGLVVNTSGRLIAWLLFWHAAAANLAFGRGMGAGTIVNSGAIDSFRVPHNEYLRLIVDGGVVALLLVAVAFGIMLRRLDRMLSGRDRTIFRSAVVAVCLLATIDNTLSTPQFTVPIWLYLGLLRQGGSDGVVDERG